MRFAGTLFASITLVCLRTVAAGPGSNHREPGHSNYGHGASKEHIQEHIRAMVKDGADPIQLKDTDLIYYIFVLHDTNGDGYLDGHELRAAFTDASHSDHSFRVSLDEITELVDHALEEDDLNGDGKISWEEYMESQLYHGSQ